MGRIAGIVAEKPERSALLARMLDASTSEASWDSLSVDAEGAALGWCGWSSPGAVSLDGVIAVLDGHVYNRGELGAGDETDVRLVVRLYHELGMERTLARLEGDFAIAVYDARTRTLWLGRDAFGVRPLYYAMAGELVALASRPGALIGLPGVSRRPNPTFVALFAASHYRMIDNEPERSAFEDVLQVQPGHVIDVCEGHVRSRPYWTLPAEPDLSAPEHDLAEQYRELLFRAVACRLGVARRPGFTLSGGMDSSSVLACAVQLTGGPQIAYSSVYSDKTFDESEEIGSMLSTTVSSWRPVRVDEPDVIGLVERMIAAHDEPVATATWLAHFLLCEGASSDGIGALFGGLGGDELNAGEYEHFLCHFADLRAEGDEATLSREVELWARNHDHPIYRKSRKVAENGLARMADPAVHGRWRPDHERITRYASALNPELFDIRSFDPVMELRFSSYLKNRTFQDLTRETIPCCLRAEDRQATRFGLDNFVPFLDRRLVEFMFRVPGRLKFREGVSKVLLREAMRGVLPEETRTRVKKTGWNAPAHLWFAGRGREVLLDLVGSEPFRGRGIYNVREVIRLIDEHDEIVTSGRAAENHMMFLWQLVNLELWLRMLESNDGGGVA